MVGLVAAVASILLMVLYLKRKRDQFAAAEAPPQSVVKPQSAAATVHTQAAVHRQHAYPELGQHRRPPSTMTPSVHAGNQILEKA